MQDPAIFAPFLGMMLLTFVVWLVMYARRLTFLSKHKVDYRTINTREKAVKAIIVYIMTRTLSLDIRFFQNT